MVNMARKLSKKKISGWLLLLAVIIFFRCDGSQKVGSAFRTVQGWFVKTPAPRPQSRDIRVDRALVNRLDSFVTSTRRAGTLGVYVWDETAGKEVYAFDADSLMRPASNMKMLTCIAALRILGPNYRFRSGVYTGGVMAGDTLKGSIAFRFDFDPWFTPDSLGIMADALRRRGIRYVKGSIYADMTITEPMQHEEHWTMGDLKTRRLGMLYRGRQRVTNELKYALRSRGIHFADSQLVEAPMPKGMKRVMETATPVIYPIMRALLNSSNENAECLAYPLAGRFRKGQDFRTAGNIVLRRFIRRELNINPDSAAVIHDPSGLCVHDRLSARFLVRLLHYAYAHKYIYNVLMAHLPVSGETGTLHHRMTTPDIRGRIQAKTGTLTREDGITSLAGYVTTPDRHRILFAIIQNEVPVADARLWQDRFCREFLRDSSTGKR